MTRTLRSAATDDTRVLVHRPCEAPRPFVDRFLVVESTAAHRDAYLPEPGLVAAFNFRGLCRLNGGAQAPRAAITGLWDTVRTHAHSRDHAVVIVAFTATGAAALLRQPLEEFANATTDLDAVLGHPGWTASTTSSPGLRTTHSASGSWKISCSRTPATPGRIRSTRWPSAEPAFAAKPLPPWLPPTNRTNP